MNLPHWDGHTMHMVTPGCTIMASGDQRAARGAYMWDPDDPLVFSFHMEISLASTPMNPSNFPAVVNTDTQFVQCPRCQEIIPWDEFCVPVRVGSTSATSAWCLRCAEQNDLAEIGESLWVLGLEFLETAVKHDSSLGIPEQDSGAIARVWRSGPMELAFAFQQDENTMLYMTDAQGAKLFLDAVRDYSKRANFQEAYLMGGVAALEALANNEL